MGVAKLWSALEKGNAVVKVENDHAAVAKEIENKAVAVDLAVWLVQAQTQPALYENYASPQAACLKVVFDRTIHWLRHGCLPVFVIEGKSPPEKLERLQARAVAVYGPGASRSQSNRRPFSHLTGPVRELLTALGVPYYEAPGEGEAACAALNVCGWAHGCQSLDVDSLLFGAQTVYRQLHLHTSDSKKTQVVKCCMEDVRRMLGIQEGGQQALIAVAQLAGGDYDVQGAERVGDELAVFAVRSLLHGCQDDTAVLDRLAAAVAAGTDPSLDALTKCTGCKACGHEGGKKNCIKQHSRGGCAQCGTSEGCIPRAGGGCDCRFHATRDARQLNRVVRRAHQTPGFLDRCSRAREAYRDQTSQAIRAVEAAFGLSCDEGAVNPFHWARRPDVRTVAALMTDYIEDWDYNQVRLKLLPLLLEWDVRQGPTPSPSSCVQLRPVSIRSISKRGGGAGGGGAAEQAPWRYILQVERLAGSNTARAGSSSSSGGAAATAAQAEEDAAIDEAWLSGTARSRPQPPPSSQTGTPLQSPLKELDRLLGRAPSGADAGEEDGEVGCSQPGGSQAAPLGSQAAGRKAVGTLSFGEHRSLRCSLLEGLWPALVQEFGERQAGGRGRGKGRAASGSGARARATKAGQASVLNYFSPRKDLGRGMSGSCSATAGASSAAPAAASTPSRTSAGEAAAAAALGAATPSSKRPSAEQRPPFQPGYVPPWERRGCDAPISPAASTPRSRAMQPAAPPAGKPSQQGAPAEAVVDLTLCSQPKEDEEGAEPFLDGLDVAFHGARQRQGTAAQAATVFRGAAGGGAAPPGDLPDSPGSEGGSPEPPPLLQRLLAQQRAAEKVPASGTAAAAVRAPAGRSALLAGTSAQPAAPAGGQQATRVVSRFFASGSEDEEEGEGGSGSGEDGSSPDALQPSPAKRRCTAGGAGTQDLPPPASTGDGGGLSRRAGAAAGREPGSLPSWMSQQYADMLAASGLQPGGSMHMGEGQQKPRRSEGPRAQRPLFRDSASAQADADVIDLT